MRYTTPVIVDYGDLVELTQASGMIGSEDGIGKAVDVPGVSIALAP